MKKAIIILTALALSAGVKAQSFDDGVKMYNYERYQSAEKIFAPLAASNAMANYYLGLSQLEHGDINTAKQTFAKYPEDPANMAGMARVAIAQGNITQGLQLATAVAGKAKKKEWEPLKYAADAITYSDADGLNYQQAIDWYKKALEYTDNADVHIALGDAYQKTVAGGGEAMNNYEKVTTKDPKNSLAYTRAGYLWYAAKNYQLALENLDKAITADPNNPLPYKYLAYAYEGSGKYDLAYQNIQKYIPLSDKDTTDMVSYTEILFLSKHYPEAITQARQLIESGVHRPGLYGILAFSEYETKDSVEALKNIRTYFATQNPKRLFSKDYQYYAQILMQNGMGDSASYYFNRAVNADSTQNKSDIYRDIANNFKESRNYAKSAEWYDKLIKAYPETQPVDYFWRGAMYFYAKDYPNAAKAFEEMETKYPNEPSATYWRGRVAAAIDNEGKEGTAVPFFTKWLTQIGPNSDKKKDMQIAYEYLALYYYNKNDKENLKKYEDLILAIDPSDDLVKQLKEAEKAAAAPKKTTTGRKK
ncbi:MAG: tetratricopeptide repeat protein [Flavipsychrobacter sp.]